MQIRNWISALVCVAAIATAVSAQDWQPSKTQSAGALGLLEDYFLTISEDDFVALHSLLAPSLAAQAGPAEHEALHRENRAKFGRVVSRTVQKSSWYPGRSVEGTGLVVAIDFDGRTERGAIVCGYVALIERVPNSFAILRDDTTYADPRKLEQMSPPKLSELFDRPGCRKFLSR